MKFLMLIFDKRESSSINKESKKEICEKAQNESNGQKPRYSLARLRGAVTGRITGRAPGPIS